MNLSPKDQRILTFILPALVAATYGFLWIRPTLRETQKLETSLRTLGDESTLSLRREQLNAEHDRLRKRLAAAEAQAASNTVAPQVVAEDSAASLRRLQDTFHRNGVRLISASVDAQRDDAAGGIAVSLRQTGVLQPKAWTVTVEAPYAALLRLLDDCSTNQPSVVPETLSMRSGPGDSKTTYWTLNVCL
jgi:hypothetical protein